MCVPNFRSLTFFVWSRSLIQTHKQTNKYTDIRLNIGITNTCARHVDSKKLIIHKINFMPRATACQRKGLLVIQKQQLNKTYIVHGYKMDHETFTLCFKIQWIYLTPNLFYHKIRVFPIRVILMENLKVTPPSIGIFLKNWNNSKNSYTPLKGINWRVH